MKGTKKPQIIRNKSGKPNNIIVKENDIYEACVLIEKQLPVFMKSFFVYLKNNVLPMTRLAYLRDIKFFCDYLINESDLLKAENASKISLKEFNQIKARDVNFFLDYCRRYKVDTKKLTVVYENNNRSLARKKSSLSVMFKHLYRDELLSKNITDGFDPIRVPKPGEKEIKALQDHEVMIMLDAVTTGSSLTKKEKEFWERTKHRDKAILILFLTYGLRISELHQLNISSFNFNREEFIIYRKRGKESTMPLNQSVTLTLSKYINLERPNDESISEEHRDALFLSLQKRRITERQIRELVKKYTSIGLSSSRNSGYSPHKLRATTATSLIGRGNSIYDVQALMDHDNVTTTQLYAAHRLNTKRDLVKNMEWEKDRIDEGSKKPGSKE